MDTAKKIINPSFENWVNNNRALLEKYKGKWVALTEESGIVASNKSLEETEIEANKITKKAFYYFVNPLNYGAKRFLPIWFNTVKIHHWQPLKYITLKALSKEITIEMLIDSGADCSLITYETGLKLGLTVSPLEDTLEAVGIGGGKIEYVIRKIEVIINSHTVKAPIAWVQTKNCADEIIGREVIFDAFDIEFKQADEEIIFKYRKPEKK